MTERRHFLPELVLLRWISFIQRFRVWIILVLLTAAGWSVFYIKDNLGMNTDTRDMLSPELPWRKLDLQYEQFFPRSTNNILVVIESETPDQSIDAAENLYSHLKQNSGLFKYIYAPGALPFFRQSAFLFLSTEELRDLSDNLAAIQPFLARLVDDQSMRGLFSMLTEALQATGDGEEIDLAPLFKQIRLALSATRDNQPFQISWQNLMDGKENTGSVHREFIIIQPYLDYGHLLPATDAIAAIRKLADELEINQQHGVRLRLTGSAVLSHEELLSVSRVNIIATAFSLVMVAVLLSLAYRSAWLVAASLITLLAGLIFTAAFATLTVGELNLISVAFAVLYIGLGTDYAIHFCLHYRELQQQDISTPSSLRDTSVQIGRSLTLCAATTAIGFFAFIPTDYDGVAELGWISGCGMFISLFITMSLLPALLSLIPLQQGTGRTVTPLSETRRRILSFPLVHAGPIRLCSFILTAAMLALLPLLHFDHNTLNLQDPGNESVKTYQDLLADSDTSPWSSIVLAENRDQALQLKNQLGKLDTVDKVVWLDDFVPEKQQEKLAVIDEMNYLLGTLPEKTTKPVISTTQQLATIQSFLHELQGGETRGKDPYFDELKIQLTGFLQYLESQPAARQTVILNVLETRLLASLPGRLRALSSALGAEPVGPSDLPPELVSSWLSQDHYLLEIFPRENLADNSAMRRFVTELQAAVPRVTGPPVVSIEASDAVVGAFQQAFFYALIAIVLILLVMMRMRDAIIIISCLLTGALLTVGSTVLLDIPMNFANIIALPLLLGIGVDSSILIAHRYRTILIDKTAILATSSAKGVIFSNLTTICSIGNLAFSSHRGMASMGELLTIGIVMMLISSLILLPALLVTGARILPGKQAETDK